MGDRDIKRTKGGQGESKKAAKISDKGHEKTSPSQKVKERQKRTKTKKAEPSEDENNDSELENAHTADKIALQDVADTEDSNEEGDPSQLVHETIAKPSSRKGKNNGSTIKTRYAPHDETSEQRDARTIFVGNLSIGVVQKRVSLVFYTILVYIDKSITSPSSSSFNGIFFRMFLQPKSNPPVFDLFPSKIRPPNYLPQTMKTRCPNPKNLTPKQSQQCPSMPVNTTATVLRYGVPKKRSLKLKVMTRNS